MSTIDDMLNNTTDAELVKRYWETIKKLQAENKKLKSTMELHAGDCCSLNNEVELFRGHWEDAEKRCDELYAKNKKLKESLLYYRTHKNRGVECNCGNIFYAPFDDLDCPFCEEIKCIKGLLVRFAKKDGNLGGVSIVVKL